ncbi:uncharacterized protein LOC115072802 [Nannospalax galili]|uniref:uncharacterized protein LOC115072802 n=1 Tax=Nannospalax galili TaxID=1026970 RepID=UPI00111C083E|nr:uncharacterized protein LOC115072802 [Nannospalax galili]
MLMNSKGNPETLTNRLQPKIRLLLNRARRPGTPSEGSGGGQAGRKDAPGAQAPGRDSVLSLKAARVAARRAPTRDAGLLRVKSFPLVSLVPRLQVAKAEAQLPGRPARVGFRAPPLVAACPRLRPPLLGDTGGKGTPRGREPNAWVHGKGQSRGAGSLQARGGAASRPHAELGVCERPETTLALGHRVRASPLASAWRPVQRCQFQLRLASLRLGDRSHLCPGVRGTGASQDLASGQKREARREERKLGYPPPSEEAQQPRLSRVGRLRHIVSSNVAKLCGNSAMKFYTEMQCLEFSVTVIPKVEILPGPKASVFYAPGQARHREAEGKNDRTGGRWMNPTLQCGNPTELGK